MEEQLVRDKDVGNALFKAGDYEQALTLYSSALSGAKQVSNTVMAVTLLCNKAAVLLKMENYQRCIEECNEALQLQPDAVKALYRRAQAYKATKDLASAYKDLAFLLKLQPSNVEAIALMRLTREAFSNSGTGTTEVGLILSAMMKERTEANNSSNSNEVRDQITKSSKADVDRPHVKVLEEGMKSLISLCSEEKLHAMDFARRAGVKFIAELILQQLNSNSSSSSSSNSSNSSSSSARTQSLVELAVQLLASCCSHQVFVTACVKAGGAVSTWSPSRQTHHIGPAAALDILNRELIIVNDEDGRSVVVDGKSSLPPRPPHDVRSGYVQLSFEGLCLLSTVLVSPTTHEQHAGSMTNLPVITVALLMRILKSFPLSRSDQTLGPHTIINNSSDAHHTDNQPSPTGTPSVPLPFLTEISARCFLRGLFAMLKDVLPHDHVLALARSHTRHDKDNGNSDSNATATANLSSSSPSSAAAVSSSLSKTPDMSVNAVIDRLTIVTDALSVIPSSPTPFNTITTLINTPSLTIFINAPTALFSTLHRH